jgi:hypothetical protein
MKSLPFFGKIGTLKDEISGERRGFACAGLPSSLSPFLPRSFCATIFCPGIFGSGQPDAVQSVSV